MYECHSNLRGWRACLLASDQQAHSVQLTLCCAHSAHVLAAPLMKRQTRFPSVMSTHWRLSGIFLCTELKLKAHSLQLRRLASKGRSHATKTCEYSEKTFDVCNPDSHTFVFRPWSLALAIQKQYCSKFSFFHKMMLPQVLLKVSDQSVFSSTTPEISCWAPCTKLQNILRCLVLSALNTEV